MPYGRKKGEWSGRSGVDEEIPGHSGESPWPGHTKYYRKKNDLKGDDPPDEKIFSTTTMYVRTIESI